MIVINSIIIIIVCFVIIILVNNFIKGVRLLFDSKYARRLSQENKNSFIKKFLRNNEDDYYKILRSVVSVFLILSIPIGIIIVIAILLQFINL